MTGIVGVYVLALVTSRAAGSRGGARSGSRGPGSGGPERGQIDAKPLHKRAWPASVTVRMRLAFLLVLR